MIADERIAEHLAAYTAGYAEGVTKGNPILVDAVDYYLERRSMNNPKGWEHVLRKVKHAMQEDFWPASTVRQKDQAIQKLAALATAESENGEGP